MKNNKAEPTLQDKLRALRDMPPLDPATHPSTEIFQHAYAARLKDSFQSLRNQFTRMADILSEEELAIERARAKRGEQPPSDPESIKNQEEIDNAIARYRHASQVADEILGQVAVELLDTFNHCFLNYYSKLCQELGFEPIDTVDDGIGNVRQVYARPDGMILLWDYYDRKISSARLYYQAPEGATDRAGLNEGSRLVVRLADGTGIETVALSVVEGLREKVQLIEDEVKPMIPMSIAREQTLLPRDVVARLGRMPLWVRQMTGVGDSAPGTQPGPGP